jgi:hypothetical protein
MRAPIPTPPLMGKRQSAAASETTCTPATTRLSADPPTIEEIVTVMRSTGDGIHGRRRRGLIVVLWRAGLRSCEALALAEADLERAPRIAARAAR